MGSLLVILLVIGGILGMIEQARNNRKLQDKTLDEYMNEADENIARHMRTDIYAPAQQRKYKETVRRRAAQKYNRNKNIVYDHTVKGVFNRPYSDQQWEDIFAK